MENLEENTIPRRETAEPVRESIIELLKFKPRHDPESKSPEAIIERLEMKNRIITLGLTRSTNYKDQLEGQLGYWRVACSVAKMAYLGEPVSTRIERIGPEEGAEALIFDRGENYLDSIEKLVELGKKLLKRDPKKSLEIQELKEEKKKLPSRSEVEEFQEGSDRESESDISNISEEKESQESREQGCEGKIDSQEDFEQARISRIKKKMLGALGWLVDSRAARFLGNIASSLRK